MVAPKYWNSKWREYVYETLQIKWIEGKGNVSKTNIPDIYRASRRESTIKQFLFIYKKHIWRKNVQRGKEYFGNITKSFWKKTMRACVRLKNKAIKAQALS